MPNPLTFPISNITLTLKHGKGDIQLNEVETATALQYTQTKGLPSLTNHLKCMMTDVHSGVSFGEGGNDSDIIITNGSQDGLAKSFEMLLSEGDSLLVESPTYSGSLAYLGPAKVNLISIDTDEHGLITESLEYILDHWEMNNKGKPKPRVLYTIPTGSNPSGGTMSLDRKKAVYNLAIKHDLVILEDDPYYFLNLEVVDGVRETSFLTLDRESGGARVLRFDSFSKLLSAGVRVGFVTGPKPLIERLDLHTQATMLHASGLSQAVVSKMFDFWGGTKGFLNHCDEVATFYKSQRDAFVNAADKHLKGLVEFNLPTAGMFCWMKLVGINDSNDLIMKKAVKQLVLLVPGSSFLPTSYVGASVEQPTTGYVRASYSTASHEQMEEACKRLKVLLEEEKKS